jgi:ABC-2 type transport system permease protein
MAGIGKVGVGVSEGAALQGASLARQQMATVAWLRWRMFVNSLRGKGARSEIAIKFLTYPVLAIIVLAPSTGAGAASYYFVHNNMDDFLAIVLWIIFAIWQIVGVSTSSSGPSFDLSSLIRLPIRYSDYLLIRLSFGLLDPPTLIGVGCLTGMTIGIAIAAPALAPWAAVSLLAYAVGNILFSRMVYAWIERWLAQRRTRELITVFILVGSLLVQVGSQLIQRMTDPGHHHGKFPPLVLTIFHTLVAVNWFLPPGLAAASIWKMHSNEAPLAFGSLLGLLAFGVVFLYALHRRVHAEYMGENLSEAPAAGKLTAVRQRPRLRTVEPQETARKPLLPPVVAASLIKEVRYLLRSGPKLYALIMPVFMVLIFALRTSGMRYSGFAHTNGVGYLFSYGCVYLQLILVGMLYNSLGNDGAGIQFYFLAPVRMREVLLGKNLMTAGIMLIEVVLLYAAVATVSTPPAADITAATVTWLLFSGLLNISIGNMRSIISPKAVDAARVRRQNVSGLNTIISLVVVLGTGLLGAGIFLGSMYFFQSYWTAAIIFLALSVLSFAAYVAIYRNLDGIAFRHRETLTGELCKG